MKREELTFYEPSEIERRSFAIIEEELLREGIVLREDTAPVMKRVIHTTADFGYVKRLFFSEGVIGYAKELLRRGSFTIVTDTDMAMSGIHKASVRALGGSIVCFMGDSEVLKEAKERGVTRAAVAMEHAAKITGGLILVIGNAPTALISIYDLVKEKRMHPALLLAAPVGFVNVMEAKELTMELSVPKIVAKGRQGGSNVAAAMMNALLYQATGER